MIGLYVVTLNWVVSGRWGAALHDDENPHPFGNSIGFRRLGATNEEGRRVCRPFALDQSETLPASFA
jgi:hypothetical protein